jgi:hypothetical protein
VLDFFPLEGEDDVVTPLRVGNASGFYGDRFGAMAEMLTDGPLDVLTGDYLAELTMLILGRDRMKDPDTGYAKTFLRQMETCLGLALDRGVKIVVNAGGLNPLASRPPCVTSRRASGWRRVSAMSAATICCPAPPSWAWRPIGARR